MFRRENMYPLIHTNWIWSPEWEMKDDDSPRVVYFRKCFFLNKTPDRADIKISADTRYKLYVNGSLIETGPSKGDFKIWYADEIDITASLREGDNVLAVAVLRYPAYGTAGNHSMFRTGTPGLYLRGCVNSDGKCTADLSADESWRCHIDRKTCFYAEEDDFAPLIIHENASADKRTFGWRQTGFDDSEWARAKRYRLSEVSEVLIPEHLAKREIPFMYRKEQTFDNVFDLVHSDLSYSKWERFLKDRSYFVTLPPESETDVVFDAGEETNGYLRLAVSGGAGAQITLLEAECYVIPTADGFEKRDRLDKKNGVLNGYRDTYTVFGAGTGEFPEVYEPYWYRTFRFVRMTVKVGKEPLTLCALGYEETGYPLNAAACAETSDPSLSDIWDISLRTLRLCMYETYMDCPFYEQLQYAMDTRSQILYTYAISADDRLARKAIGDFSRAQRPDGLLNASYPNMNTNVIPGFSIYYILMVHDHMMYFGDKALVTCAVPVIGRALDFFDSHLTESGLVDKIGGINRQAPFWSFIDWADDWLPTTGMPRAGLTGPVTMESLLYILGLQRAAELAEYVDLPDTAKEYRTRAAAVREAVRNCCMDKNGMITDGPVSCCGNRDISQHAQVFGILTGTLTPEEGRRNLLATIGDHTYTQCTVAMSYYLFRAMEKTDLYEYTDQYWQLWRDMIKNGCTTCVESEGFARSECHAWGSLALYELPSVILGVRPAAPGYEKIRISPNPGYLTHASGTARTPWGDVQVSFSKDGEKIDLKVDCPDALKKIIIMTT